MNARLAVAELAAAFLAVAREETQRNPNRNGEAEPNLPLQRHDGEAEPPTTAMAKPSRTGQCIIGQPVMR
jgi:hypothetical protein